MNAYRILHFVLLMSVHFSTLAQVNTTSPLQIKRTSDFKLSGDGAAAAWSSTAWITLSGGKGDASQETKSKLLYSETGVYALFSCADSKITSTLKEDFANLWTEDVVEIFFWPEQSTRLYFEYEISPTNYELAILCPNFNGDQFGWRPWQYEGKRRTRHLTKISKNQRGQVTGWTAEVFIPFELLRPLRNVPAKSGTEWKINMYRIDYDRDEAYWMWQPVEDNFHDIERYGTVVFE